MEVIFQNIIIYALIFILTAVIFVFYLRKASKKSKEITQKIEKAKEFGIYEPVSLHPVVDPDICIGSGACISACPEKDILGIVNGRAHTINASQCVGHGACFHACPVQAISLCIGTEKRGVELPHISKRFETNIRGIYIAGELGGMGLIKNAVAQGKQAVENFAARKPASNAAQYDIIIVGAGPAGISATLEAEKLGLKHLTLEQDSLGGTVYTFPRAKIVMTSPMYLPLYGRVKLSETSKTELLNLWYEILKKYSIKINEFEKVEGIEKAPDHFVVTTNKAVYTSAAVLLSIGRRGTPRKLNVPGEGKEKVAYRLIEPEIIQDKNVLVVGGGDSAVETAMLLTESNNRVSLSYRRENFSRLKPKNIDRINSALESGKVKAIFNSNVKEIKDESVILTESVKDTEFEINNDLVYIFAGGELPSDFLSKIGIKITKKFGDAILTHTKK